ncbi:MAG: hypothetical protein JF888_13500 [Candidatus Dormibacteraeota bacterium]|uniref:Uncharacterized protein n=1 Tax=Candidatus Dormiibacter inghamiae TaxID=3127013 RepID=A0A934KIM9_9BACT|nr:hypothetical protein [Candidatus Dormibacteraeota bacterium]MBJ7606395.1 hypothetical protein [Candidatus Dormibacteraeota bacterium]
MNSRVLVTGAASPLGAALGRRVEQREEVAAIFGLDLVDPRAGFERLDFVYTDDRTRVDRSGCHDADRRIRLPAAGAGSTRRRV